MRTLRAVPALLVATVALTGCTATIGGVGTQVAPAAAGTSSGAPSGAPSGSTADVGTLVQQGFDALAGVNGVHIRTTVTGSNSGTIDMQYGAAVAIGTIDTTGAPVELRKTPKGEIYVKGPMAFWTSAGVPSSAATALSGKFVHVASDASEVQNFVDLLDLSTFVGSIKNSFHFQNSDLVGTTTIEGIEVYQIGDEGTDSGALYLAVAGDHQPIEIVSTQNGTILFDDYGKAPDVTEPPANQVIELPK